jgi:protein TonB
MSGQVHGTAGYFELPEERRPPFWRPAVLVLLVLGVHLSGLFLAFGMVSGQTPPETLPVLTVRVLELAPVLAKVEESRTVEPPKVAKALEPPAAVAPPEPVKAPRKLRQQKPARALPVPAKKPLPTPPALLTAALAAAAATSFAVAPQAASPAVASPLALAAPLPVVGARFDADYLRNPPPVYPAASRRLGEEGRVVLRVMVSAEGLPLSVEIKQASGFRRLDEAARAAVERWRFVPARRGATAIESSVLVPLQFTLKG